MAQVQRFALPDVGEGLTEAEVVRWRVAVGDVVAVNDPVVEVETAKSIVELPSPFAGVVDALLVEEGVVVDVGTPLLAVASGSAPGGTPGADAALSAPAQGVVTGQGGSGVEGGATAPVAEEAREAVLVGYGVRSGGPARRRRRTASAPAAAAPVVVPTPVELEPAPVEPVPVVPAPVEPEQAPVEPARPSAAARVLAKPPVRALARTLGLDLSLVTGTGHGGVVTREDLLAHRSAASAAPSEEPPAAPPEVAARETRIPVRGVRKATAQQMVASAFTAPHATAFVSVDVTRTMKLLDRLRTDREFKDVHVSPLLVVMRAVCLAVARNPGINARWDEAAQEIVHKHYVNLGIAVATPRGLLVPNIKDAERLSLRELADALTGLVRTARDGRTQPAELSGGTISITNIGVFGVDTGTPLLNAGEAAILCLGAVKQRPWVHKGKVKPRWVTELSVSFDHRLVDGDLGSKFLADVAAVLERPDVALRWA